MNITKTAAVLLTGMLVLNPLMASEANANYDCLNVFRGINGEEDNCRSTVEWVGGTIGGITQMYLTPLAYQQNNFFINAELWLKNTGDGSWLEVGATAQETMSSQQPTWFWANMTPGGSYDEQPFMDVPNSDLYNWIPMWIIRDNDTQYSGHIRSSQGEMVVRIGNFGLYPDGIEIGHELYGQNTSQIPPVNSGSSGGLNHWINNQWIDGGGTAWYQTSDGDSLVDSPPFYNAGWAARPSQTPYGGEWVSQCCN